MPPLPASPPKKKIKIQSIFLLRATLFDNQLEEEAVFRIRIHLIWIRIQHFRLNTDPDPGFWWPKIEKNLQLKFFFWSKTTIYLILGLHKRRPSFRRSLQPSKANIKHFKTWNFLFFLLLWVIFSLLDPAPDKNPLTLLKRIQSGSETLRSK